MMQLAVWLARLLFGATFVISGMAKMIDPYGTVYKITDYLAAWGGLAIVPHGLVVMSAFALALIEFLLGINTLLGTLRRFTPLLSLAVMCFMLPLSAYIWAANPVTDCGCFGDLWIISNSATFAKNMLLFALALFLLRCNRRAPSLFHPHLQWLQITLCAAYCLLVGFLGWTRQPLIDFRPYPAGSTLTGSDDLPTNQAYIYRSPTGQLTQFDIYSLPNEDEGWEFVEVKELPLPTPSDTQQERTLVPLDPATATPISLPTEGELLLLVAPNLSHMGVGGSYTINELAARMPLIALSNASPKEIEQWRDLSMASYPIYRADDKALKTLARGEPAVVMLRNDTILWKRTLESINPAIPNPADYQWADQGRFTSLTMLLLASLATLLLLQLLIHRKITR